MNVLVITGRLTKDPESRMFRDKMKASFVLAVDRRKRDETDFINCSCWGAVAENVMKYMSKGRLVACKGSMRVDHYEKDGQTHKWAECSCDEVQFLDKAKDTAQSQPPPQTGFGGDEISFDDSTIPF
jgi:single-strand DNA-binding protein